MNAAEPMNNEQLTVLPLHHVTALFREMSKQEFESLRKSLDEHGQRETIKIYDGKVIDGRHRLKALQELRKRPIYEDVPQDVIARYGDLEGYVRAANLERRHLSVAERALYGAKNILPKLREAAKDRKSHKKKSDPAKLPDRSGPTGEARALAANAVGVSSTSITHAVRVLKCGLLELEDAVRSERVPLAVAASWVDFPTEQVLKRLQEHINQQKPKSLRAKTESSDAHTADPTHEGGPTPKCGGSSSRLRSSNHPSSIGRRLRRYEPVAGTTPGSVSRSGHFVVVGGQSVAVPDSNLLAAVISPAGYKADPIDAVKAVRALTDLLERLRKEAEPDGVCQS